MLRLKPWQWIVLILPIAAIVIFVLIAAGSQIHQWHLNWIWAVFTLIFVPWRWLLVKWTRSQFENIESVVAEVTSELESAQKEDTARLPTGDVNNLAEVKLQEIIQKTQQDRPIWEDIQTFFQRCQELVIAIAQIYHPEVKYPLLNIYIPQAYGLIRGTVDDLDLWIQKLSPALNQVSIAQAYEAYQIYQKLEPSARKLWKAWGWAQWLLNPAAALAGKASRRYGDRANQELLLNLSQLLREAALKNLSRQAIALYGGIDFPGSVSTTDVSGRSQEIAPTVKTQTLREILDRAEPVATVEQKPLNILLVGRTGAGKSSLINSLFKSELAAVDVLPSTERMQNYQWQTADGEILTLWDTPGYEQVNRADFRKQVLEVAIDADLLLLVTPALDPALQMDFDFLKEIKTEVANLPVITIVTQVDRLRPIREWEPPYDWRFGERPKEIAIREASQYRLQQLGDYCYRVLPIVTGDAKMNRIDWGIDNLSLVLIEAIDPAKQIRLSRFLKNLEARAVAAAKIIDRYTLQMATTQGLTAFLKSPVLQFIATLSTGTPTLAYLLAEQIPVEQLPIVIGKLQMAYDLYSLFNSEDAISTDFNLLSLWSLLLENSSTPERNAWAFGHALVEYWTQNLTTEQLGERFQQYLVI
jgi:small GTP-binding protein